MALSWASLLRFRRLAFLSEALSYTQKQRSKDTSSHRGRYTECRICLMDFVLPSHHCEHRFPSARKAQEHIAPSIFKMLEDFHNEKIKGLPCGVISWQELRETLPKSLTRALPAGESRRFQRFLSFLPEQAMVTAQEIPFVSALLNLFQKSLDTSASTSAVSQQLLARYMPFMQRLPAQAEGGADGTAAGAASASAAAAASSSSTAAGSPGGNIVLSPLASLSPSAQSPGPMDTYDEGHGSMTVSIEGQILGRRAQTSGLRPVFNCIVDLLVHTPNCKFKVLHLDVGDPNVKSWAVLLLQCDTKTQVLENVHRIVVCCFDSLIMRLCHSDAN